MGSVLLTETGSEYDKALAAARRFHDLKLSARSMMFNEAASHQWDVELLYDSDNTVSLHVEAKNVVEAMFLAATKDKDRPDWTHIVKAQVTLMD